MLGRALNVVIAHRPPLVFVDATNPSASKGYLIDLLNALLKQTLLPTKAEYHVLQVNGTACNASCGGHFDKSSGNWTGVMGELVAGRADVALFPLTLTEDRHKAIDHMLPFMDNNYGVLVRNRQMDSGYSMLLPFDKVAWGVILLSLFMVVLLILGLDIWTRRARLQAVEQKHGNVRVERVRRRDRLMGHTIETVMMAVGSGSAPTSRSCSVKIMFVAWAIFCAIMYNAYNAILTSNLTVAQMGTTIQSLSDLAQGPLNFAVPKDSSVAAYIANSGDQVVQPVRHKMVEYAEIDKAVAALRAGELSAYVGDYPVLQYYAQTSPCDLALATEVIGSGALVIGLSRNSTVTIPNSTLKEVLDVALLQLSENGKLADLKRRWFIDQCPAQDPKAKSLKIQEAQSIFLVLPVGAAVAIIVAVAEVYYYKRWYPDVEELRQELSITGPRRALTSTFRRVSLGTRDPSIALSDAQLKDLEMGPTPSTSSNLNGSSHGVVYINDQSLPRKS